MCGEILSSHSHQGGHTRFLFAIVPSAILGDHFFLRYCFFTWMLLLDDLLQVTDKDLDVLSRGGDLAVAEDSGRGRCRRLPGEGVSRRRGERVRVEHPEKTASRVRAIESVKKLDRYLDRVIVASSIADTGLED